MKKGLEFLCGALILLSPCYAKSADEYALDAKEKEEYLHDSAKNRMIGADILRERVMINMTNADFRINQKYTNETERVKNYEAAATLRKEAGDCLCIMRDLYIKAKNTLILITSNSKKQQAIPEIDYCKKKIKECTVEIPVFYEGAAIIHEGLNSKSSNQKAVGCREDAAKYLDLLGLGKPEGVVQ